MSLLLTVHSISKSYGSQILFKDITFSIGKGERIGLIGPNGSGKSTILKLLAGNDYPNEGHISRRQGLKVGYASQSPEFSSMTLEETLVPLCSAEEQIDKLTQARILLGKMEFPDPKQNANALSGGWKKRLDLAKALIDEPDLLLLDEPTNHLDLEGILWLEKFLKHEKLTYIVVSHDRYFLENISNRIIELNRCYPKGLFSSEGNMSAFLEHKEAFLQAQHKQERSLAGVLRNEIDWLKRSPKARTTKSQSRVQRTHEMIDELSELKERNKEAKVKISFSSSGKETRKLLVAKNLAKSLGDKQLFRGLDLVLSPGMRLGIVGKNGTGKTTLLKILAGELPQDQGTIKYADGLKMIYFDQQRHHISNEISLREALSPVSEMVNYRGQFIHVNGWAKKFLFSPDRLNLPVGCLSGGEKARIFIAKLMLQPADVLFLDEPTNDLDIPTLQVIEESLNEFPGAVVLISHDRCLMDQVCTQVLGLGEDLEESLFADYSQWENAITKKVSKQENKSSSGPAMSVAISSKSKKLSYKDQRELDGMEQAILAVEEEMQKLQHQLNDPTIQINPQKSLEVYQSIASHQQQLDTLFQRWEILLTEKKD